MFIKNIFLAFLAIFLIGCSSVETYNSKLGNAKTPNLLPQHIKKIAITKFQDDFRQPAFQDKLYFSIKDKFTIDRRVQVAEIENSDAVLVGNISRYFLQPLEYDSNKKVRRYLLWIWIDISVYDNLTKKNLWTENHLEAKVEYNTVSSSMMFEHTTETEAQDIAIDSLADSVIKRTIDGWFAASGATDRVYS